MYTSKYILCGWVFSLNGRGPVTLLTVLYIPGPRVLLIGFHFRVYSRSIFRVKNMFWRTYQAFSSEELQKKTRKNGAPFFFFEAPDQFRRERSLTSTQYPSEAQKLKLTLDSTIASPPKKKQKKNRDFLVTNVSWLLDASKGAILKKVSKRTFHGCSTRGRVLFWKKSPNERFIGCSTRGRVLF